MIWIVLLLLLSACTSPFTVTDIGNQPYDKPLVTIRPEGLGISFDVYLPYKCAPFERNDIIKNNTVMIIFNPTVKNCATVSYINGSKELEPGVYTIEIYVNDRELTLLDSEIVSVTKP